MIVTRRFVFLHLHKSGGTFVNQFLLRFFPDARWLGYHLPRSHLPQQYAGLPAFGLVRSPWDYYVSWYSFQAARSAPNALFAAVSDGGRLGFCETVRNLVTLGEQPALLAAVRAGLPEDFPNSGINLTRRCLDPFAGSGLGFYSFMFERMYGDGAGVQFGRMESLRGDLSAFLESVGVSQSDKMRDYLAHREPANTSSHAPYWQLYDEVTRQLVASRDAPVIRRFGYEFGAQS